MKTQIFSILSLLLIATRLFAQVEMQVQTISVQQEIPAIIKGKDISFFAYNGNSFIASATNKKGHSNLFLLNQDFTTKLFPLPDDYKKSQSGYICKFGNEHLIYINNKGNLELATTNDNLQISKKVNAGKAPISIYLFYKDDSTTILLLKFKKSYEFVKVDQLLNIVARQLAPKEFSFSVKKTDAQWMYNNTLCTVYYTNYQYVKYIAFDFISLELVSDIPISHLRYDRLYNYPQRNIEMLDIYPNKTDGTFAVVERYLDNFPACIVNIYDIKGNSLQEKRVKWEMGKKIAKGTWLDSQIFEDVQALDDNRIVITVFRRPLTQTTTATTNTIEYEKNNLLFYIVSKDSTQTIDFGEIGDYDFYPFFLLSFNDNEAKILAFENNCYNILTADLKTHKVSIKPTATTNPVARISFSNGKNAKSVNAMFNKYETPFGYIIDIMACQGLTLFRNDQSANMQNAFIFISKDMENINYYTSNLKAMLSFVINYRLSESDNANFILFNHRYYSMGEYANFAISIDKKGEMNIKDLKCNYIPFKISDTEYYLLNDEKKTLKLDKLIVTTH